MRRSGGTLALAVALVACAHEPPPPRPPQPRPQPQSLQPSGGFGIRATTGEPEAFVDGLVKRTVTLQTTNELGSTVQVTLELRRGDQVVCRVPFEQTSGYERDRFVETSAIDVQSHDPLRVRVLHRPTCCSVTAN